MNVPTPVARIVRVRPSGSPTTIPDGSSTSTMVIRSPSASRTASATGVGSATVTVTDWSSATGGRLSAGPTTVTVAGAEAAPDASTTVYVNVARPRPERGSIRTERRPASTVITPTSPFSNVSDVGTAWSLRAELAPSGSTSFATRSGDAGPADTFTSSAFARGASLAISTVTRTTVESPPGSEMVTVHEYVPLATSPVGVIDNDPAEFDTHPGAPETEVIANDSSSLARAPTGITRVSPRPIRRVWDCPTGSWFTSIVTAPVARWRQSLTTAYEMMTLPFVPAGGE